MDEESRPLDRIGLLEFDLDLRLREIWHAFAEVEDWNTTVVAAFIRAAYARGYVDALREDTQGERAKLCKDNGYRPV